MREIKCARCGQTTEARSPVAKYCRACARDARIETAHRSRQGKPGKRQTDGKRPPQSIKEINAEARAHGMSYGQWVAQMGAGYGQTSKKKVQKHDG